MVGPLVMAVVVPNASQGISGSCHRGLVRSSEYFPGNLVPELTTPHYEFKFGMEIKGVEQDEQHVLICGNGNIYFTSKDGIFHSYAETILTGH